MTCSYLCCFVYFVYCRTKVKRGKVEKESPEPEPTSETPASVSEGGSILSSLKESSYRVRWLVDSYEATVYPEQGPSEFEGDNHMVNFDDCQFRLRAQALHDVADTLDRLRITDVAVMMSEDGDRKQGMELESSIKGMKEALSFSKNLSHAKVNMIAEKINRLQHEHNLKMQGEKDEMRKRSKIQDIIEMNKLQVIENEALKKSLDEKKSYLDMKSRQKGKKSLEQLREEFEAQADQERTRLEELLLKKKSTCETVASGQAKRALKLKELQAQLAHTIANYGNNIHANLKGLSANTTNAKSATHYSNAPVSVKVPTAPSSRPSTKASTAPSRPVTSSRPVTGDSDRGRVGSGDVTMTLEPLADQIGSEFVLDKNSLGERIAKREVEVAMLRASIEGAKLHRTAVEAEMRRCSDIVAEVRHTITKAALSEDVQSLVKRQQQVEDLRQRLANNQSTIESIEHELAQPMPDFLEEERLRLEQERREEELRLAEEAEARRLEEEEATRLAAVAAEEEAKRLAEEAELLRTLQQAALMASQELSIPFEESNTALMRRRNEPVFIETIVRTVRPPHLSQIAGRMMNLILTARNQLSAEEAALMAEEEVVEEEVENEEVVVPVSMLCAQTAVSLVPVKTESSVVMPASVMPNVCVVDAASTDPVVVHSTAESEPEKQRQTPTGVQGQQQYEHRDIHEDAPSTATVSSTIDDTHTPSSHLAESAAGIAFAGANKLAIDSEPVEASSGGPTVSAAENVGDDVAKDIVNASAASIIDPVPPAAIPSDASVVGLAASSNTPSGAEVKPSGAKKALKTLKSLVSTRMFLKFTAKPVTPVTAVEEEPPKSSVPGTATGTVEAVGCRQSTENDEEYCDPSQDFGLVLAKEHLENLLAVLRPTKLMTQHTRILDNLRESCGKTEESLVALLKDNAVLRRAVNDSEKDARRFAAQLHILRKRFLKTLDGLCGLPTNISLTEEELHQLRDKLAELTKTEQHFDAKMRAKREQLYVQAIAPHGKQREAAVSVPRVESDHSLLTNDSLGSKDEKEHAEKKHKKKKKKTGDSQSVDSSDPGTGTLLDEYKSRTMLREVIPTPFSAAVGGSIGSSNAPVSKVSKSDGDGGNEVERDSANVLLASGSSATLQSSVSDITNNSIVLRHYSGVFVPSVAQGWAVSADSSALREDDILRQYISAAGGTVVGALKGKQGSSESPTNELSSAEVEAAELAQTYGGGQAVHLDCRSPEEIARNADMGILHKLNYYYKLKKQQAMDFKARIQAQQMRLQPRDTEFYQRVPKIVNTPTVQFSASPVPARFFPYNANTWFAKDASRTRSPAVTTLDTKEQEFRGKGGYRTDGLFHEFDDSKPCTADAAPASPHASPAHPQPWRIGRLNTSSPPRTTRHFVRMTVDVDGLSLVPRPPSGSIATIVGADISGAGTVRPGRIRTCTPREKISDDVIVDLNFDSSVGNGNYPVFNDEHVEFVNSQMTVHQYLAPRGNIAQPPSERKRLENNMKYVQPHKGFGSFPPLAERQNLTLHLPKLTAELLEETEALELVPQLGTKVLENDGHAQDPNSSSNDISASPVSTADAQRSANPYDYITKNIELSTKKVVQFPTSVSSTMDSSKYDLAYIDTNNIVVDKNMPRDWERSEGIDAASATQIIDSYKPALKPPRDEHKPDTQLLRNVIAVGPTKSTVRGAVSGVSLALEEASTASDYLVLANSQMHTIVDEHMTKLGSTGDDENANGEEDSEVEVGVEIPVERNHVKGPRYMSQRDPVIDFKLEAFQAPKQNDSVDNTDALQQHYSPVKQRYPRLVHKVAWGVKKPLLSALHSRTKYAVSRGFSRAATGFASVREQAQSQAELDDELDELRGIYNEYSQDESAFGDQRGASVTTDVSDVLYGMSLTGATRHSAHQRGRTIVIKKNPYAEDTHLSAYYYDADVMTASKVMVSEEERDEARVGTETPRGVGVTAGVSVSSGGSRVASEDMSVTSNVAGSLSSAGTGNGLALDGKSLDAYNSKIGAAAGALMTDVADAPTRTSKEKEGKRMTRSDPTGQVPAKEITGLQVVAAGVVGEKHEAPVVVIMGDSDDDDDLPAVTAATPRTMSVTLPSIVPSTMDNSCLNDVNFEEFV